MGDSGCDYNADGFNYDYPNAPANGALYNGLSRSSFLNGVFPCNSSVAFCGNVFPGPALGQEGNLGRNTFIGPGYADSDLTAMKNTKIPWFLGNEGANLQFRAEFYNAFNRVNLTQVDGNLSDSTFGHSTNTFPARNVQFALRLLF